MVSDHCPVILDSTPPVWGLTPFRFENKWLHHNTFSSDLAKWWKDVVPNGWEGYKFMNKLKHIKERVKIWKVEVFGDSRLQQQSLVRRIKELDALEHSGNWNNQLKEERFLARTSLEKMLLEEERALRMKTKFTWAKEGDANTKLFHSLMNARKAKNVIAKLELEDGRFIDTEEDVVREVTGFFQGLYTSENLCFRGIEGIDWKPIPLFLAEWLERPFEVEKVKKAIFEYDGNKAPSADGFTLEFFQSQWETLKEHIMKVLQEFDRDGIIHGVTNETYICLIPKKANSTKV